MLGFGLNLIKNMGNMILELFIYVVANNGDELITNSGDGIIK